MGAILQPAEYRQLEGIRDYSDIIVPEKDLVRHLPYYPTLARIREILETFKFENIKSGGKALPRFPFEKCAYAHLVAHEVTGLPLTTGYYTAPLVNGEYTRIAHVWVTDLNHGIDVDLTQDQFSEKALPITAISRWSRPRIFAEDKRIKPIYDNDLLDMLLSIVKHGYY